MYTKLIRHSGNRDLFQAVALSASALMGGHPLHLHVEGLRGTGKTTILRAAGQVLPPIERIGRETVPCPFLEISHSAKVGTVVGTIDLARLVDRGEPAAALLPGTILQAHRGVVFIDEINRLADTSPQLADILLDVMGTKPGRVQVEETGLQVVEMPVEVTVWAASNPDEEPGALAQVRKQLADRFDMVATMGRPSEYGSVMAILAHRDGGAADATGTAFRQGDFHDVTVDEELRQVLAALYIDFGLESLRAVEGLETAARLAALHSGRSRVLPVDLVTAAPLVLAHRTDNVTLTGIMKQLQAACGLEEKRPLTDKAGGEPRERRAAEAAESGGRWRQWWADLRRRLSTQSSRQGSSTGGAGKGGGEERQTGAGGGARGIADPMQTAIVSPPNPAVPLAELPAEKYVSGEDNRHG